MVSHLVECTQAVNMNYCAKSALTIRCLVFNTVDSDFSGSLSEWDPLSTPEVSVFVLGGDETPVVNEPISRRT
jgi:hypothetical protein